jgi:glycosyltransferase involved in cell wall biosynthesis
LSYNILIIPSIPWLPYRKSFKIGSGPNPLLIDECLHQRGFDITIFDPYKRPLNPYGGTDAVFLQSLDPLRALKILTLMRRFDLIISVFDGGSVPLLFLRKLFGFKTPIAIWDVGLTENWPMRERVLDFVLPNIDGIMVLSESQKKYIEKRWKTKHPVIVIGHSIDTTYYSSSRYGVGDHIFSIGDDGSRDYDTLIESYYEFDKKLIIKTNIKLDNLDNKNIDILRNKLSFAELRDLYDRSQVVVVPLYESLNVGGVSSVLEASAMGRPIVVSSTFPISDFIVPNVTCLVVPQRDKASMHFAIKRILEDDDLAYKLGHNARNFVEKTSSLPVFSDRLSDAMLKIMFSH